MRSLFLSAASFTLLSSCAMQTAAVPDAGGAPTCDLSRSKAFIGKQADVVAEKARIGTRSKSVRIIAPGTAVTMDYRGDRLNLKTDDAGAVTEISCG